MDQGSIKGQTLIVTPPSNGSPNALADANAGLSGGDVYRNLLKVLMSASDGLKCEGNPFHSQPCGSENHISELCRLGEIERTRSWLN